jgi:hypothetical protein
VLHLCRYMARQRRINKDGAEAGDP